MTPDNEVGANYLRVHRGYRRLGKRNSQGGNDGEMGADSGNFSAILSAPNFILRERILAGGPGNRMLSGHWRRSNCFVSFSN